MHYYYVPISGELNGHNRRGKRMSDWLEKFLASPKAAYFIRVDHDFLVNSFNMYGLKGKVPHFTSAYDLLRRGRTGSEPPSEEVTKQAEILYGLVHARFILTKRGLQLMNEKYNAGVFAVCPRVFCRNVYCLPYGLSEVPSGEPVKMYCPSCCDIYSVTAPEMNDIDGAFFGPNWVHLFLHRFKNADRKSVV